MRKLITSAFVAAVMLAGSGAFAQQRLFSDSRGVVLNNVALNAAAATRTTSSIPTIGFSTLTLGYAFTFAAATSVNITYCEGSLDTDLASPTWYKIPVATSISAAGLTNYETYSANASDDGTNLAANYNGSFTISVIGHRYVRCVFAGGGTPGAGDLLTVRASVSVP